MSITDIMILYQVGKSGGTSTQTKPDLKILTNQYPGKPGTITTPESLTRVHTKKIQIWAQLGHNPSCQLSQAHFIYSSPIHFREPEMNSQLTESCQPLQKHSAVNKILKQYRQ